MAQQNMHAIVSRIFRSPTEKVIAVPEPRADELLVRVHAVGLNPADIKLSALTLSGKVCGCEWAGTVEKAGKEVQGFKQGDRIAGFAPGGQNNRTAAFAEFLCCRADSVFRVPSGTSMEEAASLGVGMVTSMLTLRQFLGYPGAMAQHGDRKGSLASYDGPLLVWSAATAFGMHAVQLAKILSPHRKVIATASAGKHDLLRSLGADFCFDYSDPDVVEKIRKLEPIRAAIDTFGEAATTEKAARCLTVPDQGEAIILSSQPSMPFAGPKLPRGVRLAAVMSYTASGEPVRVAFALTWPASPEDALEASRMMESLPDWIETRRLRAMPTRDISKSLRRPANVQSVLQCILQDGLPLIAAGKVRGEKLVAVLREE